MKKFLPAAFIAISIIIPCKTYAFDITVGVTTWYAWMEQYMFSPHYGERIDMRNDSLFFGPVMSVKFNEDFNLTLVFLHSRFDLEGDDAPTGIMEKKFTSKRYDADLALNYRLNNYFKIFAGIKYLEFNILQFRHLPDPYNTHVYTVNNGKHKSLGPGSGLSFTCPVSIIDNLFLLAILSGFYLFPASSEKLEYRSSTAKLSETQISYKEYGVNTTLQIAYYIEPLQTVISLGGRMQYFITKYKEDDYPIKITHPLYGITLAATYTFNF